MAMVNRPGSTIAGMMMFQEIGIPKNQVSQFGMMRRAPSRKPMYQSGWEPALTWSGVKGPKTQIGLRVTRPPMRAMMPKTTKKKPPALAMYTGISG